MVRAADPTGLHCRRLSDQGEGPLVAVGSPRPPGLGPALGQGGLGRGQVRGAQVGEECDGALGVAAALGTAALAGQGLCEWVSRVSEA